MVPFCGLVPGPISGLTAVQGPDFIMLQWSPPLVTNGRILAYVISYMAVPSNEIGPTAEALPLNATGTVTTASDAEVTGMFCFVFSLMLMNVLVVSKPPCWNVLAVLATERIRNSKKCRMN